ncbi:MAG: ribosome silencing factor [Lachnospirales bacterium]
MTDTFKAAKAAYKALDDKMAVDIKVLDIKGVSSLADYFVIASGNNPNQLRAMADEVDEQLFKAGFRLKHSEGMNSKNWILMDFGDIVVHLFNKEDRGFYNIERIWGDAKEVPENELK